MRFIKIVYYILLTLGLVPNVWGQTPIESLSKTYNFGIGQVSCTFVLQDAELKIPLNETGQAVRQSVGTPKIENQTLAIAQGQLKTGLLVGYQHQVTFKVKGFEDTTLVFDFREKVASYTQQQVIALKPKMKEFTISLKDIETNEKLAFGVVLTNKKRGQKIYLNSSDLRDGEYVVRIRVNDSYDLEVNNSKSYAFYATKINHTTNSQQIQKLDIKLIPYKLGALIPLKNITFATKSAQLNANSFAELDRVTKLLKDHPTSRILIEAHTDSDGSYQGNLRLSRQRAQNVLKYLVQQGINTNRLETKGLGSAKPIAPNDTKANKALNRRFDIIVLKK